MRRKLDWWGLVGKNVPIAGLMRPHGEKCDNSQINKASWMGKNAVTVGSIRLLGQDWQSLARENATTGRIDKSLQGRMQQQGRSTKPRRGECGNRPDWQGLKERIWIRNRWDREGLKGRTWMHNRLDWQGLGGRTWIHNKLDWQGREGDKNADQLAAATLSL